MNGCIERAESEYGRRVTASQHIGRKCIEIQNFGDIYGAFIYFMHILVMTKT